MRGFFVTKAGGYTLAQAKKILESRYFYDYLVQIGILQRENQEGLQ